MTAKRARCVILSQLFYPETVSTGTLLTELAEAMVERGMDVTAICGQPTYYEFRRAPRKITHNGVTIIRPMLCTWFRKDSTAGRLFNITTFLLGALWRLLIRRERGPLLIVTNPPFLGVVGYICKKLLGTRYVCLVHDVYPDVLPHFGIASEKSLVVRLWHRLNRRIYGRADRVISLGRAMADVLAAKDPRPDPHSRIDIIPNWSNGELIVPGDKRDSTFFQSTGVEAGLVMLYSGNFGRLHDVGLLVDAMEKLADADVHLMFVGGGQKKPMVEKRVADRGLTNVTLYPYQPLEEIGQSLTGCDVQVAVLDEGVTGLAVPCKLYGMLASGKPLLVVCNERGEMGQVVLEEKCGLVVPPGDLDALVEAICYLRDHQDQRAEMGRRARAAFENKYTLAHVADQFIETLTHARQ